MQDQGDSVWLKRGRPILDAAASGKDVLIRIHTEEWTPTEEHTYPDATSWQRRMWLTLVGGDAYAVYTEQLGYSPQLADEVRIETAILD
ncbi:hypothetical protein LCGC14_3023550 [marine sediment metagenome]|uniref:Uncharacterized protein n=1 Tax=marine sediment metagenome TaxID=412755 RepID=A0A0F8Z277_9ZZZZ